MYINENFPSKLLLEYSIFFSHVYEYRNDRMKCDICVENATAIQIRGENFQKSVC